MRVHIDTGLFIDYLSGRGHIGTGLRSAGRRRRSLQQVLDDAERALYRIAQRHDGATSVLTYDEAMLRLDNVIRNEGGKLMRCYDSDDALSML